NHLQIYTDIPRRGRLPREPGREHRWSLRQLRPNPVDDPSGLRQDKPLLECIRADVAVPERTVRGTDFQIRDERLRKLPEGLLRHPPAQRNRGEESKSLVLRKLRRAVVPAVELKEIPIVVDVIEPIE